MNFKYYFYNVLFLIYNISQFMKQLPSLQGSQSNLKIGFQSIGKILLNSRQWNGKFGQLQNQHKYPQDNKKISKFGKIVNETFQKVNLATEVCGLCQVQKKKSEMERMCRCHHSYCFSCLNSYAICKIQELIPVKCPQQDCPQSMPLTSNIYRYLPDTIKLKFLQNIHAFKISKQQEANRCQRCLQQKHMGECQYSLSSELVETSFKHRQCPKCKVEIQLTSGKRKVTCSRCQTELCYLCGVFWLDGHNCTDKAKVRQLQRMNGYHGCCTCCCDCCSYGCEGTCSSCGDSCCRQCGDCFMSDCCELFISCQHNCGIGCIVWNILSIPVRIVLTMFAIVIFLCLTSLWLILIFFWLFLCCSGGLGVMCQKFCDSSCPITLIMIIFLPFVYLYGVGIAIRQTAEQPVGVGCQLLEGLAYTLRSIWVKLSPGHCLD